MPRCRANNAATSALSARRRARRGEPSPPGKWDGAYSAGARAALAGDITVTASPDAIHAYGIVVANSPGAGIAYQQEFPGFDIVPRLPDGQFLTSDHVIVSADTITRVIHGSDADQLIYETGSGNVTIIGGAGINLLYAGSGNDTLVGGPNRDYLFGGSGSDSFSAAAGSNYMEAGSGAAVFVLAASDAAQDLIADFKPGDRSDGRHRPHRCPRLRDRDRQLYRRCHRGFVGRGGAASVGQP